MSMRAFKRRLIVAALSATVLLGGATLTAGPALAADSTSPDYSWLWVGVYGSHPLCPAEGGGCMATLYFDCEGLYGPSAACDDPAFWAYWDYA